jgi:hypothetical protein
VTVAVPVLLFDVQFDIAANQAQALHFQQGVPKIWACGGAGPSRIHHPDRLTGLGAQAGLPCRPVLPELGQQPFRYFAFLVLSDQPQ